MNQERELDSSLNDGELSRLYAESTRIEPPAHLDAAILAEAHRAVQARPEGKRQRRWAVPLGLVASLFVMIMVGLQLPYMLRETPPLQAPMPTAMEPRIDESSMAENAPAKRMRSENIAAGQAAKGEGSIAPAAPPAEAAPVAAMQPAPAAKAMEMRKREESARMDTLESEKKSAYSSEGNLAPAMKPQAPAAAVAAPAPVLLERALLKDESAAQRPEEWLKRIEKLKQEGKQEEVKKELEAFRKRYPDYPIPAGLK
jgi:resuscitation-promoting factor RpfA